MSTVYYTNTCTSDDDCRSRNIILKCLDKFRKVLQGEHASK